MKSYKLLKPLQKSSKMHYLLHRKLTTILSHNLHNPPATHQRHLQGWYLDQLQGCCLPLNQEIPPHIQELRQTLAPFLINTTLDYRQHYAIQGCKLIPFHQSFITGNLGANTRESFALLNVDQTPATLSMSWMGLADSLGGVSSTHIPCTVCDCSRRTRRRYLSIGTFICSSVKGLGRLRSFALDLDCPPTPPPPIGWLTPRETA